MSRLCCGLFYCRKRHSESHSSHMRYCFVVVPELKKEITFTGKSFLFMKVSRCEAVYPLFYVGVRTCGGSCGLAQIQSRHHENVNRTQRGVIPAVLQNSCKSERLRGVGPTLVEVVHKPRLIKVTSRAERMPQISFTLERFC